MSKKKIGRDFAITLLEKYGVPENIVRHSLKVEKVAVFVAQRLKEKGVAVNIELVSVGAILHDIGKMTAIKQGVFEQIVSREILEKEGLKEEAMIAFRHNFYEMLAHGCSDWGIEEKIVYFADKRVMHDSVVSLQERMADLNERYPKGRELFRNVMSHNVALEKEILALSGLGADLEGLE